MPSGYIDRSDAKNACRRATSSLFRMPNTKSFSNTAGGETTGEGLGVGIGRGLGVGTGCEVG